MNVNRHRVCPLATILLVALANLASVAVSAADSPVGSETRVRPTRRLYPREAAILASAGTKVLVQIAEARGAIQEEDTSRARQDLRKAEKLLNIIRSTTPTRIVKDRIWIARRHLEYEGAQQVLPDLVSIDRELTLLGERLPIAEARSHLEKARGFLKSSDKKSGDDELKAVDAAVVYEEVDLPVSETEAHVSRALSELAIGEREKADSALRAAEGSVQLIVATAREPLMKDSSSSDAL